MATKIPTYEEIGQSQPQYTPASGAGTKQGDWTYSAGRSKWLYTPQTDYSGEAIKNSWEVYNNTQPQVSSASTSRSSEPQYSASDIFESLGLDRSNKKALYEKYGVDNALDFAEAYRDRQIDETRNEIEAGYGEVYKTLDMMKKQTPEYRAELEGGINQSALSQLENIGLGLSLNEQKAQRAKEEQQTLAKSSLRELSNDITNSMQAAGQYLGAAGAGSSSAVGQASEALTRAGQKARAGVLEGRNKAIADIEMGLTEARTVAEQAKNEVAQWKATSLSSIAQQMQQRMDQLNLTYANAKKEEKVSIANLIKDTWDQFIARAQQLDDMVTNYQMQVDQWEMQQMANAKAAADKLSGAEYGGLTQDQYQDAINTFSKLVGSGMSREAATAQINQYYGTYLTPSMFTNETEESVYKPLTSPVTGSIIGQYDPTNPLSTVKYAPGYDPNDMSTWFPQQ